MNYVIKDVKKKKNIYITELIYKNDVKILAQLLNKNKSYERWK